MLKAPVPDCAAARFQSTRTVVSPLAMTHAGRVKPDARLKASLAKRGPASLASPTMASSRDGRGASLAFSSSAMA